jgi:hypothetical protein
VLTRVLGILFFGFSSACFGVDGQSIARIWNEEILAAIRIDVPHPPVHARNLFHLSVGIYDAWAAYDPKAVGYLYRRKHYALDPIAARREAISYAAYRILSRRYLLSRNPRDTAAALAVRMTGLGFDTNNFSADTTHPAGVGNAVAAAVLSYFQEDGARELQKYSDFPTNENGYVSLNAPLNTQQDGTTAVNVNHWQPLYITNATTQNGVSVPPLQTFIGAHWSDVRPFALSRTDTNGLWNDPGPPPQLNGTDDAQFREEVVEIIRRSSDLNAAASRTIDVSPKSFGNNTLGKNDGLGHMTNPATGKPYTAFLSRLGDYSRVLTEHWADGPQSETPPGHWNRIANQVSEHPEFTRRMGGSGPLLDPLEWDVKLYFALNAALHDAACAAWSIKRRYDGPRPISIIRYMGQRGQSSDPNHPTYHPDGLPLVPGLIELATDETTRFGGRHFGYVSGALLIFAWAGPPADPATQTAGVDWIPPEQWFPYQRNTFVTPAFPGYISGHSTFSRAAAEVLTAMTGSKFFPGGLYTQHVLAKKSLIAEQGPSEAVQLQAATYYDAADQAGLSRIWGGIHVSTDDLAGRKVGAECGVNAWTLARKYFDGSITRTIPELDVVRLNNGILQLKFATLRGFHYVLESTANSELSFREKMSLHATDTTTSVFEDPIDPRKFYRIIILPEEF